MSRIRANTIVDSAATGAPTFPNGAIINGITTITADVSTTGNNLTIGTGTTISNPSDNEFRILTNGSERVRVGSGGSVGIGSDNPAEKLDVNGALKVYKNANIATFKNNQLRSDAAGTYYFDHGTTGQSFTFRTSTSSSLDTTGPSVTSAGNISFPSGQGIDFSATSDAGGMSSELLDDYEEGTFTPNVTFNGNSVGLTYSSLRGGSYTKVGRLVTCYIAFEISDKGSSTGNMMITGLPFTSTDLVSSTSIEGGGGTVYMDGVTGTIVGPLMAAVVNNQSYFDVYYRSSTTASSVSIFTNTQATDSLSLRFQISYPAA